jgi:type IV secretion system protein VirD4
MKKAPPTSRYHSPSGLPLGWLTPQRQVKSIGFGIDKPPSADAELLSFSGESHLLCVAPTGAGKGRSVVIPALLSHPGPTLTIDLKGENYQVTARYRRELGHRVVALDPFRIVVAKPDALNPLDLFQLPGSEPDCESELLAELLTGGQLFSEKDRFWDQSGKGLLVGLTGLAAELGEPGQRSLSTLLDYLHEDDVDYKIATTLDKHTFQNDLARRELAAYLNHESDKCRPSVRSTAQAMVKCLSSRAVRAALGPSTFDLAAWMHGDPLDIYLIFPPDKLDSHRGLLRLWLGTLLAVLLRRPQIPEQRTLLLLDEAAQLGTLPQLRTALTLLRGYGVQVWSLWQDLSQLRLLYPLDWETILNNSAIIQAFGLTNGWVAKGVSDVLGVHADDLLALETGQQILLRPGHGPVTCRRVDYLSDPLFRHRFDANPRYAKHHSR